MCSSVTVANALNHWEIEQRALNSMVFINTNNGIGNGFFVAPYLIVTGAHFVENSHPSNIKIKSYGTNSEIQCMEVSEILHEHFLAVLRVDTSGTVPPFADGETIYPNHEVYIASASSSIQRPIVEIKRVSRPDPRDYCRVKMKLPLMVKNDGGPVLNVSGEVVGIYFGGWALEAKPEFDFSFAVPINAVRHWIGNGQSLPISISLTQDFCKKALRKILKGNAAARKAVWLEGPNIEKYLRLPSDSSSRYKAAAIDFFRFVRKISWKDIRRVFRVIF